MGMIAWSTWGIYLIAQLVAGVAAGLVFRVLNLDDK
jgi:glycerol uptake facilitator-like aquaporin